MRLTLLLLCASLACKTRAFDGEGWPCEDDRDCLPEYVCSPFSHRCVGELLWGCEIPGWPCPPDILQGDGCPFDGAFIPCVAGVDDCSQGCRVCLPDLTWSECRYPHEEDDGASGEDGAAPGDNIGEDGASPGDNIGEDGASPGDNIGEDGAPPGDNIGEDGAPPGDNIGGDPGSGGDDIGGDPASGGDDAGPSGQYAAVVTGGYHACALKNGEVYCWGEDEKGEIGDGGFTNIDRDVPNRVDRHHMGGATFTHIATGPGLFNDATCGLADGNAYCWGEATFRPENKPIPVDMTNLGGASLTTLSASEDHFCGMASNGNAYCWGNDGAGKLGNDDAADTPSPAPVPVDMTDMGSVRFTSIVPGQQSTCGLGDDGRSYCWGNNLNGALGDGGTVNRFRPTLAAPVNEAPLGGAQLRTLSVGDSYACGIATDDVTYCWGTNYYGTIGIDDFSQLDYPSPTPVMMTHVGGHFTSVYAGVFHTCAIASDGHAYCWGTDISGELGHGGPQTDRFLPWPVDEAPLAGDTFATLSPGYAFSCGLTVTGRVFCWGSNNRGQCGNPAAGGTSPIEISPAVDNTTDACPSNYVRVPPLAGYTDLDFCVMKYEARVATSLPVSQPEGLPDTGVGNCTGISAGFRRMDNNHWQTVARNIELQDVNWSGGIIGSGYVNIGVAPLSACDSLEEYVTNDCTGIAPAHFFKRTHVLSNGEIIWDLGGNGLEVVDSPLGFDWGLSDGQIWTLGATQGNQNTDPLLGPLGYARDAFGVAGTYSGLDNQGGFGGYGSIFATDPGDHILRGGGIMDSRPGIFRVWVTSSVAASHYRCVYY